MSTLQKSSLLKVSSKPLEKVAFDSLELKGEETLSEPFSFTLIGRTFKGQLSFDDLIGQEIGLTLALGEQATRHFHGHVGEIESLQTPIPPYKEKSTPEGHIYKIVLHPLFGLLQQTQDCRIFQNLSTLDIVKKILSEHKVIFSDKTKQYGKKIREFCVQYNESHFHFVSRLLEEEGIFYFFTYTASEHRMILADDLDIFQMISSPKEIIFERSFSHTPYLNHMLKFKKCQHVVPGGFGLNAFHYEKPETKLYTKVGGSKATLSGNIYEYPGLYTVREDGEKLVKTRLEAKEFNKLLWKGTSTVPALYAGAKCQLKNHPDPALNASYTVFSLQHHFGWRDAEEKTMPLTKDMQGKQKEQFYQNDGVFFPALTSFRPLQKTPKPRILGTQTAVVTGKAGEEIWTEELGRIKVKFHWDIHGEPDEKSSCWIRVSTPWAGHGWGAFVTPRIGQEVVISYIEGNPDFPLVVGCVYNGAHHPPYPPTEATKSTFKSHSSKEGEGFNEWRFDDKKGEEEIYVHAQKDAKIVIEDSRTTDINTGSCTTTLHRGDRRVTLSGEDKPTNGQGDDYLTLTKGSRTVELQAKGNGKGNLTTTLHKGDEKRVIKEGDQAVILEKGDQQISLRKGDRSVSITGNDTLKISQGNLSVSVTRGNISIETTGNETHTVQGNMKLNVTGNMEINATGSVKISGMNGVKIDGSLGGLTASGMTVKVSSTTNMDLSANALMNIKGILVNLN